MEDITYKPINLVRNPLSSFPDYIEFTITDNTANQLNKYIEPYKELSHPAQIYSLIDNKTVTSNRRVSEKKSFRDISLKKYIEDNIILLVKSIMESTYPEYEYDITVGDQQFDYIKYNSGGYFEKHTDFVRINSSNHQQYTMLFGLSDGKYSSGNTILWFPVDSTNLCDYEALKTLTHNDKYLYSKYKIPTSYYSKNMLELLENNDTIKMLPLFFNILKLGNVLLFKSSLLHSGEKFNNDSIKELGMVTLNFSVLPKIQINKLDFTENNILSKKITIFNNYELWMNKLVEDKIAIPFQIILCKGTYENKNFSDKYLRYWNLDLEIEDPINNSLTEGITISLNDIYNQTKLKFNSNRGRKHHIGEVIKDKETSYDNFNILLNNRFIIIDIEKEKSNYVKNQILNFFLNYNFENNLIGKYQEEILNSWEKYGCNDSDEEYDEIAYLQCNIDIKFGFYKLTN